VCSRSITCRASACTLLLLLLVADHPCRHSCCCSGSIRRMHGARVVAMLLRLLHVL
jgi:hypothetical protein